MTHFLATQMKRFHLGLGKLSLIRSSVNCVAWVSLSNPSFPPFLPPTLKLAIKAAGTEENEAVGVSKYYWALQENVAPLFRRLCSRHILIASIKQRGEESKQAGCAMVLVLHPSALAKSPGRERERERDWVLFARTLNLEHRGHEKPFRYMEVTAC